jgi:hypothetical protein
MQFTPQQLAGAGRFTAHTRIGNWLEDVQLEETKYMDYASRKEQGKLASNFRQQKLVITGQRVPHSFSADGWLRFGDTITIAHMATGGSLACDLWEETSLASGEHLVTVSKTSADEPTARNTFTITRSPDDDDDDPVLVHGQAFRLRCNSSLLIDAQTGLLNAPSFLSSRLKNDRCSSKLSNNQQVFMSTAGGADSLWKVAKPCIGKDGGMERLMAEGEPVPAGGLACILHVMTSVPLSADPAVVDTTDFGDEFEACGEVRAGLGKSHQLVDEMRGIATAETASKNELQQNQWRICTSLDEAAAQDNRQLPPESTPSGLMSHMGVLLGGEGVEFLEGKLAEVAAGGLVDREDVKWVLREDMKFPFSDRQFDMVLDTVDDGRGMVDAAGFAGRLRE